MCLCVCSGWIDEKLKHQLLLLLDNDDDCIHDAALAVMSAVGLAPASDDSFDGGDLETGDIGISDIGELNDVDTGSAGDVTGSPQREMQRRSQADDGDDGDYPDRRDGCGTSRSRWAVAEQLSIGLDSRCSSEVVSDEMLRDIDERMSIERRPESESSGYDSGNPNTL